MKSLSIAFAALFLLTVVAVGGLAVAHASDSPAAPQNVRATNGPNPGEANVAWNAVSDASYYRIGWIAMADYEAIKAAGGDWMEGFVFVDIANRNQTAHTVAHLTPGIRYAVIVASNDTRYGAPKWSQWAYVTLNADDSPCPAAEPTPTTPTPTITPAPTVTPAPTITPTPNTSSDSQVCKIGMRLKGSGCYGSNFRVFITEDGCLGNSVFPGFVNKGKVCGHGSTMNYMGFSASKNLDGSYTITALPSDPTQNPTPKPTPRFCALMINNQCLSGW